LQVFFLTNFWEHLDGPRELTQGKAVVDACVAAGIHTVIFSGLDSPLKRKGISGVHHFEYKYQVEDYLMASAIPVKASVRIACYYENWLYFFPPRMGENGKLTVTLPCGDLPIKIVSVAEYGKVVAKVLADAAKYDGKRVNVCGDFIPVAQMCASLSDALGQEVVYVPVPEEVYASFGFPGADDLAHMFRFFGEHGWTPGEDDIATEVGVTMSKWDEWVHRPEIVAAFKKATGTATA
jgi:uncharacterized protein YbjT (DUF2867 family)